MNNILDFKEIGNRIRNYRIKNQLTQDELAELIDTSQKYISRIEAGSHELGFNTIAAISKALHFPIDALLSNQNDSSDESTLFLILDKIRGMSPGQLEMVIDSIDMIQKYEVKGE